jgi:hypothetical protein
VRTKVGVRTILAEASLLAYWPAERGKEIVARQTGLQYTFYDVGSGRWSIAWNDQFSIVSFVSGSTLIDHVADVSVSRTKWERGGAVRAVFAAAVFELRPKLEEVIKSTTSTPLFFTRHGLGGALATLAADLVDGRLSL